MSLEVWPAGSRHKHATGWSVTWPSRWRRFYSETQAGMANRLECDIALSLGGVYSSRWQECLKRENKMVTSGPPAYVRRSSLENVKRKVPMLLLLQRISSNFKIAREQVTQRPLCVCCDYQYPVDCSPTPKQLIGVQGGCSTVTLIVYLGTYAYLLVLGSPLSFKPRFVCLQHPYKLVRFVASELSSPVGGAAYRGRETSYHRVPQFRVKLAPRRQGCQSRIRRYCSLKLQASLTQATRQGAF